jgi:hypothetical protein
MKVVDVLEVKAVSAANAVVALEELRQCIRDTQEKIREDSTFVAQHLRMFGLGMVQTRLEQERLLLRSLRRREAKCLRLLAA